MKFVKRWGDFMFWWQYRQMWFGASLILIMAGVTVFTFIIRNTPLAGAWIAGTVDYSQCLNAIAAVTVTGYTWYRRMIIRINLFYPSYPRFWKGVVDVFSVAYAIFFLASVVVARWGMASSALKFRWTSSMAGIPLGWIQFISMAGLIWLNLVFLRSLIGYVLRMMGKPVEHDGLY